MKIEKLRLAHYNILYGGEDRMGYIEKVIEEIHPDICGILEAVGWQNDRDNYGKIAKSLGYDIFDVAVANTKHSMAVFSKIPITIKSTRENFKHVVLEVKIESGPFKGLNIFFVHLSPVSEDERLVEMENILKYVSDLSPVIIMGDFNSLSSHDPYDRELLLKEFKKNQVGKYGLDRIRFDVIEKIESAGFIDSAKYLEKSFGSSTPTPSNRDRNHPCDVRIDYAFLDKNIIKNLINSEITKDEITEKASDHYPLFIDLAP